MKKSLRFDAVSMLFIAMLLISSSGFLLPNTVYAQGNTMTFTTGNTITFTSNTDMAFWSGVSMTFGTGIQMRIFDPMQDGVLQPCDVIQVLWPMGYLPPSCSWWEVLDPLGQPIGEFHVDWVEPGYFHIDMVWPGPIQIPIGIPLWAEMKIDIIEPCGYYVVHEPSGWYPEPCSWWEIIDPETRLPTGYEFHVDWTNESCEFHIDEVTPHSYILPFPWYEIEARQKITEIKPCDWFVIIDPAQFSPTPCSWWEVMYNGAPTGKEFHVDQAPGDGTFHVDQIVPSPLKIQPTYPTYARQKIDIIQPCEWFKVDDPAFTPKPCSWWKITHPSIGDVEFHVDQSDAGTGVFHVDQVVPSMQVMPTYQMTAEKKFTGIGPCDWFKIIDPLQWVPLPCTWWRITEPAEWAGVTFHVDSNDGIDRFHIDAADSLPPGPTPPPWEVTAEHITPPDPWYWKPKFTDYALAGMPDFDQRQGGTYPWRDQFGAWSHCGPVAVANSLWWLDSEFEPHPVKPPTINDGFPLVQAYGQWDDHDPLNVPPLVEHLAYLMDTDGRRTGLIHTGTYVHDMEAGLSQYLSWTGVNPLGDVNGDGTVDPTDLNIVTLAMGSVPGAPNWNLAADIFPASMSYPPFADNVVNMNDQNLVLMNMGKTGLFYEHTVDQPDFYFIEEEVEKCQDVVLLLGYWIWNGQSWYRESGHYVTVAGVDSSDVKLAISDPVEDAFERGLIPEGRVPILHAHMPPEPPYITHNNASYVSHDIYNVVQISPMFPPCPGGNWALQNYVGWQPTPPYFTVIESAVITSPSGTRDVAVTNVKTIKDGCPPMRTIGQNYTMDINVTVENQGNYTETFTVTVYANTTVINQTLLILPSATITSFAFNWSATLPYGNYTISAVADTVPTEIDTADNTFIDGTVLITIPGDITTPLFRVQYLDLGRVIGKAYGKRPGQAFWDPNTDLNNDHKTTYLDLGILLAHYGWQYP
jgi:hypothetical protein